MLSTVKVMIAVFSLFWFLNCPETAFAEGGSSSGGSGGSGAFNWMSRKAEVKKQTRWSLDEWLATRDRNRWMDMWLAIHSPSPYEFFLLTGFNLSQSSSRAPGFPGRLGLGAYASIVGLEVDHEQMIASANNYRFHLRVFGYNVQNTNLTLQLGLRQRKDVASFRQDYAGASLTLYLSKFFGVYSLWRYHFGSTPGALNGVITGPKFELGPFIEFGPLRLFGDYVYERESGTLNAYSVSTSIWLAGAQLFF